MKNKLFAYLVMMLPALLLTSCLKDQDDVFDKSASIRSAEYLTNAQNVLVSAENGWVMNYYPDNLQQYGGFSYVLKFDRKNVTAYYINGDTETQTLSDGTTQEVPVPVSSTYSLSNEDGPVIAFDTYNKYLHYYATPSSGSYQAMGGDFIFIIMKVSDDQNTITLKGNRSGNTVTLYRNTTTPEAYISGCKAVMDSQLYETFTDNQVLLDLDLEAQQAIVTQGEESAATSFVITDKGIKLYRPVTVGGKTYDTFTYDATNHTYTPDGDQTTVLTGKLPDGWRSYADLAGRYRVGTTDNGPIITVTANGDGESYTITNLESRVSGATVKAYYKFTRGSFVISPQYIGRYGDYYAWLIAVGDNYMSWSTSLQLKGRITNVDPLTMEFSGGGGEYNTFWTYAFEDDPPTSDGRAGYFTQFDAPFTLVRVN